RGQRLMRDPEGLDMDAIVKRSVAAYWTAWDKRVAEDPVPDPAFNWWAVRRLSTWGDFLWDLGAGPLIVVVLVFAALPTYGRATTWSALGLLFNDERFWPMTTAFAIVLALTAGLYRAGKARTSIGALAACAFVGIFVSGFSKSIGLVESATDLARRQLEQAAL